jgi:hypothetical protein
VEQDKVSKLSEVGKNVWDEDASSSRNVKQEYKPGLGERWNKARAAKKVVFFSIVGAIVLTMFVGFNWGGWVTGGTAQKMTSDAITQRLSLICVGQFEQDPNKDQKLTELQDTNRYQRDDYVVEQGWATMPGEAEAETNSKIADECAKLIVQSGQ